MTQLKSAHLHELPDDPSGLHASEHAYFITCMNVTMTCVERTHLQGLSEDLSELSAFEYA